MRGVHHRLRTPGEMHVLCAAPVRAMALTAKRLVRLLHLSAGSERLNHDTQGKEWAGVSPGGKKWRAITGRNGPPKGWGN